MKEELKQRVGDDATVLIAKTANFHESCISNPKTSILQVLIAKTANFHERATHFELLELRLPEPYRWTTQ